MKVTVVTLDDLTFSLDVSEDLELENFKAFCEVESGLIATEIMIFFNSQPLTDNKKTLSQYGIRDGDLVTLQHRSSAQPAVSIPSTAAISSLDFSSIQVPHQSSSSGPTTPSRQTSSYNDESARSIRDMLLVNKDQLAILQQNNPSLAEAVLSGSLDQFASVLRRQYIEKQQKEQQKMKLLTSNPFDTEAQRLIAEEIRQKNIEQNMEAAIEYNPETFGTVVMLYINCRVNGHPVKAFIDSGAQATIMSSAAAERCNIMRLVDTRWAGIAKGVGVQRIIGRIHMVQIQIENDFLTSSFSVLEAQPMDMLLGLDMLKRHQCSIDLKNNFLIIGTTGTRTPFLSESELPDCARLTGSAEEEQKAIEESKKIAEELEMREALEKSTKDSLGFSASPSTSTATTLLPSDKFTENDISELAKNGFDRKACIEELRRFNGDKKQALASLFAKSLKF
ncbi:hypothetical protein PVAND_011804 [Polypedilum vanderplanki]|uniref:Uncharacterized protein n=1 Tax=Polypedilum vanderplanki TaxID=319348 RepID=A0A9J6CKH7_POLVA|nr:hypothetical protein PVAND_011804 [Polypedilum vanderplanki]